MVNNLTSSAPAPADPVGDALADVYTYLLRKAAKRKQAISAAFPSEGATAVAGLPNEGERNPVAADGVPD